MDSQGLMILISQGEIQKVLDTMLGFVGQYYARFAPEIYLISARYNQVERESRMGTIPRSDYNIEINSITKCLIDIVASLEGIQPDKYKKKKSREEIQLLIAELENRFGQCRKKANNIQSTPTRLREKNEISREISQVFVDYPELIESYYGTQAEGIITGIANRYKRLPELSGIDFFESISKQNLGNFTKCSIANAVAEILYAGQMRIGDDQRIVRILEDLFPNSFQTVKLSITRVSAELEYLVGKT